MLPSFNLSLTWFIMFPIHCHFPLLHSWFLQIWGLLDGFRPLVANRTMLWLLVGCGCGCCCFFFFRHFGGILSGTFFNHPKSPKVAKLKVTMAWKSWETLHPAKQMSWVWHCYSSLDMNTISAGDCRMKCPWRKRWKEHMTKGKAPQDQGH